MAREQGRETSLDPDEAIKRVEDHFRNTPSSEVVAHAEALVPRNLVESQGEEPVREFRIIQATLQDKLNAFIYRDYPQLPITVSERSISDFCAGCDYLGQNNICKLVGAIDQARRTVEKQCRAARVSGLRGRMTANGFVPV